MIKIRNSEWKVLFMQMINNGKDKWEASEIIENHKKIMKEYYEKLKSSNISEKNIEIKFKEKFWELCQKTEK